MKMSKTAGVLVGVASLITVIVLSGLAAVVAGIGTASDEHPPRIVDPTSKYSPHDLHNGSFLPLKSEKSSPILMVWRDPGTGKLMSRQIADPASSVADQVAKNP